MTARARAGCWLGRRRGGAARGRHGAGGGARARFGAGGGTARGRGSGGDAGARRGSAVRAATRLGRRGVRASQAGSAERGGAASPASSFALKVAEPERDASDDGGQRTDREKGPSACPVRAHGRCGRHLVEQRSVEHPVVDTYDPAEELDEE